MALFVFQKIGQKGFSKNLKFNYKNGADLYISKLNDRYLFCKKIFYTFKNNLAKFVILNFEVDKISSSCLNDINLPSSFFKEGNQTVKRTIKDKT